MGKLQQEVGALNDADRLREHLDVCEKAVPSLHQAESAREFLASATEAHTLLDALEAGGSDIRPELTRLSNLAERATRNARRIVRAVGGMSAYVGLRAQLAPDSPDPWWRLDEVLARARRRALTGLGAFVAAIVIVAVAGYVFRDFLFPPNPVGDAVNAASKAVVDTNDYAAALTAIDTGLVITPANAELLLWRGALLEIMQQPGAERTYDTVRAAMEPLDFLNNRGSVFLRLNDGERALADLDRAISMVPDDPIAYFLRATAFEAKSDYQGAMKDLETAAKLAESQKNDQLVAFARVRLGVLMQQGAGR